MTSIIEEHSQIDPSLKTQRCYVKISAPYIHEQLMEQKGYKATDFCVRTVNNLLNRLGYSLKKVLKTKPLKKIEQTDAIFDNVEKHHQSASSNPRILRISVDTKARVKVGNLSRNGYSRTLQAPEACDHDQHWLASLVPLGIEEINTGQTSIIFGQSRQTSHFIVDGLTRWWLKRGFIATDYDLIMIDLDNGKANAGNTKRFIERMIQFSQYIGLPIQLVYYPPYHSKYNSVERFWAALEKYWNGLILDTIPNTLKIAEQVTWKTLQPMVQFIDKVYEKIPKMTKKEFKELDQFLTRNPKLPKWDVLIKPINTG